MLAHPSGTLRRSLAAGLVVAALGAGGATTVLLLTLAGAVAATSASRARTVR